MCVAAAAATMVAAAPAFGAGGFSGRAGRGKGGKLLGDFRGTAMRALRPFPIRGADKDFAVMFALGAMKFVKRHGGNYSAQSRIGKRKVCGQTFRVMNDLTQSRWLPVALLTCSNIFMTFAWYGNLNPKFKNFPLWLVILVSWGIAFFEYVFMIPANRWGNSVYSVTQLKIIQEVITLSVFCVFAIFYLGEKIRWNYVAAFVCLLAAVAFAFWPKA
jgi:hypothetical protein